MQMLTNSRVARRSSARGRWPLVAGLYKMTRAAASSPDISRDGCSGSWMNRYIERHRFGLRCLAPTFRQRHESCRSVQYMVFRAREGVHRWHYSGGLAGRLSGLLSVFALAVSSEPMRPFLIDWPGESGPHVDGWARAWRNPHGLDLNYNRTAFLAAGIPVVWNLHDLSGRPWEATVPELCGVNRTMCRVDTDTNFIPRTVHRGPWDSVALVMRTSAAALGDMDRATEGPAAVAGARVRRLGLAWPSSYRCLFSFLFEPSPQLASLFRDEWVSLRTARSVGLQLRMGDTMIWNQTKGRGGHEKDMYFTPLDVRLFLACAEQVSELGATKLLCYPATLLPCCPAAPLPRCPAALLPCCPAALLPCCPAAPLPCCPAATLPGVRGAGERAGGAARGARGERGASGPGGRAERRRPQGAVEAGDGLAHDARRAAREPSRRAALLRRREATGRRPRRRGRQVHRPHIPPDVHEHDDPAGGGRALLAHLLPLPRHHRALRLRPPRSAAERRLRRRLHDPAPVSFQAPRRGRLRGGTGACLSRVQANAPAPLHCPRTDPPGTGPPLRRHGARPSVRSSRRSSSTAHSPRPDTHASRGLGHPGATAPERKLRHRRSAP